MGGWRPTVIVELSEQDLEVKRKALECFPSQHPFGMGDFAGKRATLFGKLAGVRYAEGFSWGGPTQERWGTDDGFYEGMARVTAPMEVVRL